MAKKKLLLFITLFFCVNLVCAEDTQYLNLKWDYLANAPIAAIDVADLDGDGRKEVVAASTEFMFSGGAGWVTLLDKDGELKDEHATPGPVTKMVVADLESDGSVETIVSVFSYIHVLDGDGELKWKMSPRHGLNVRVIYVDDLEGDGINEIILGAGASTSTTRDEIFILDSNGKEKTSRNIRLMGEIHAIHAADLDGDGNKEIFVGCRGRGGTYYREAFMKVFDSSGNELFTYSTPRGVESITVEDLDGDGNKEILVGTFEELYVLNPEGGDLWYYSTGGLIRGLAVLDIDGDSEKEVILGSNDVFVLDPDGKLEWKNAVGPEVYSLELEDLNKDGLFEILVGCSDGAYILESSGETLWEYDTNTVKGFVAADMEGDGYFEVVFGSAAKRIYLFQSETYAKEQEAYSKYKLAESSYNKKDYINAITYAQDAKELYSELKNAAGLSQANNLISKIEGEAKRMNAEKTQADEFYNQSVSAYLAGDYVNASKYAEKAKYKYTYLKDDDAVAKVNEIITNSVQFLKFNAGDYLQNATQRLDSGDYDGALFYAERAWSSYDYLKDEERALEASETLAKVYYVVAEERASKSDFGNATVFVQKSLHLYKCLGDGSSCDPSHAPIKEISEITASLSAEDYAESDYRNELQKIRSLALRIEQEDSGNIADRVSESLGSNLLYILIGALLLLVLVFFAGSIYLISKRQPKEEKKSRSSLVSKKSKSGLMSLEDEEVVEKRREQIEEEAPVQATAHEQKKCLVPKVRRDKLRGHGLPLKKTMGKVRRKKS